MRLWRSLRKYRPSFRFTFSGNCLTAGPNTRSVIFTSRLKFRELFHPHERASFTSDEQLLVTFNLNYLRISPIPPWTNQKPLATILGGCSARPLRRSWCPDLSCVKDSLNRNVVNSRAKCLREQRVI